MSDLQWKATNSVRQRGFHEAENLPPATQNRLLMAQTIRLGEEFGELMRAIRDGSWHAVGSEGADLYIVLANIFSILGLNLEANVYAKLRSDEQRGYLHNGAGEPTPHGKACAVCGEPVGGYSWWTKNPSKADAKPIHSGECWQKWNNGEYAEDASLICTEYELSAQNGTRLNGGG